jgi:hypothetical protein
MRIMIKEASDYYQSQYGWKQGDICEVFIHEKETRSNAGWYLIPSTEQNDVHDSSPEVRSGDITRLYEKPGFVFSTQGKFMWIETDKCVPFHENNKSAAGLLKAYEWRV